MQFPFSFAIFTCGLRNRISKHVFADLIVRVSTHSLSSTEQTLTH